MPHYQHLLNTILCNKWGTLSKGRFIFRHRRFGSVPLCIHRQWKAMMLKDTSLTDINFDSHQCVCVRACVRTCLIVRFHCPHQPSGEIYILQGLYSTVTNAFASHHQYLLNIECYCRGIIFARFKCGNLQYIHVSPPVSAEENTATRETPVVHWLHFKVFTRLTLRMHWT